MSGISPATQLEIGALLSEFADRVDEGRAATVHELFVPAGRIETPAFVLEGRDKIRERFTARANDKSRKSRHYWSNARFSGSDAEVTVVTNVMTVIAVSGGPTTLMSGSSTDVLVRDGNQWRFKSRRLGVTAEGVLGPLEAPR